MLYPVLYKILYLQFKGEKFFDPNFGCAVNRLLFENIDFFTARALKDEIEAVIRNNEPRVDLTEVIVTPNYDDGAMEVTIKYLIIGIDATAQQLQFVLLPTR